MTDRATRYLCESLSHKKEGAAEALRIVHAEHGYELTLDDAKDGDHIFEEDGTKYLLIDPQVSEALSDALVDIQESPQGKRVTLTGGEAPNPSEPEPAKTEPAEPEPEPKTKP